ncbi:oligopeptide ABC transporter permease [Brucella sp. 10RB9215]|nr:oligopeptide ABC transporter permease [Brucella sp. 10RB9215]
MTDLTVPTETAELSMPSRSLWQDAFLRLRKNKAAVTSAIVLVLMALIGIFGPCSAPTPMIKSIRNSCVWRQAWKPIPAPTPSCRGLNRYWPAHG